MTLINRTPVQIIDSNGNIVLPATSAKQDSQIALETTLNSLIDTFQELIQRLAPLGSAMTSGAPSLRVTGIAMPSTAVTGPATSANVVAALLTQTRMLEQYSSNAVQSNINNCIGD